MPERKLETKPLSADDLVNLAKVENAEEIERVGKLATLMMGAGVTLQDVRPDLVEPLSRILGRAQEGNGNCGTAGCC